MAKPNGLFIATVTGAILGGLFHLIMKKPVNKVENPVIQDDNKGADNAITEEPVNSVSDS